jgi:translation elongation factor P/translation initiation factor 5A
MLKITLDEGYIFDILAVINVKIGQSSGFVKTKLVNSFTDLSSEIKDQIGEIKFNKIIISDEYKDLFQTNKEVFHLIDLAKQDKVLASEVQVSNHKRFLAKSKLQNKFFDGEISEVKI